MKQIILILTLIVFTTIESIACTCPLRPDTQEDFESEWNSVESVLELKIVEVLKEPENGQLFGTRILKAEILEVYKGNISTETIEIYTEVDGGAACHFYFKLGQSYLFYGGKGEKDNYYHTTACHRTGKLSERTFDLRMIKEK